MQNCHDVAILNSLFGLCLFVFQFFSLFVFLPFCRFVFLSFISKHHSDQMSEGSDVSTFYWLTDSLAQWSRSGKELPGKLKTSEEGILSWGGRLVGTVHFPTPEKQPVHTLLNNVEKGRVCLNRSKVWIRTSNQIITSWPGPWIVLPAHRRAKPAHQSA